MTSPARYTRTAIVIHWAVATLILFNLALAWSDDALGEDWIRPMIDLHKSIGITVLLLVLVRVVWRATHPAPPLPASYPRWERMAAHVAHGALYVAIVVMPLTGWIHDSAYAAAAQHPLTLFGVIPWFRIGAIANLDPATKEQVHSLFSSIHAALGYAIAALVALHVMGALKHQWIDGHAEIQRMLTKRRTAAS